MTVYLLTTILLSVFGWLVMPLLLPILLLSFLAQIMGNKPERVFFSLSKQLWRLSLSLFQSLKRLWRALTYRRTAGTRTRSADAKSNQTEKTTERPKRPTGGGGKNKSSL